MRAFIFYPITSLLYAALAVYFWRTRWATVAQIDAPGANAQSLERFAILIPLTFHGALLYGSIFSGDSVRLGLGNALSAIVWLTVVIYWAASFFHSVDGLQAVVMPAAAVFTSVPLALPPPQTLAHTELVAFKVHLLIAMLAYSLFTIASLHVLLMALLERKLHGGNIPYALRGLPPLLTMEKLLFRIITAGFVLLTLTLATGIAYSEELFGKPLQFNHKTVFGILSWLIFAALLSGRQLYGWRGRVAVRWTLTGFFMLVLAYIGSRFVLEVILGRA